MGLDLNTGHHWSYSRFAQRRNELALLIGIKLESMAGFGGIQASWSDLPEDPLHALLNHSDCDGDLSIKECRGINRRLHELLIAHPKLVAQSPQLYEFIHDWIEATELAIDGNMPIQFF